MDEFPGKMAALELSQRRSPRGHGLGQGQSDRPQEGVKNMNQKESKKVVEEEDDENDDEDEDEEFTVEKILRKRKKAGGRHGQFEYLLKYQGYGNEFNTWEPRENLFCPDLLAEFEEEWNLKNDQSDSQDSQVEPETKSSPKETRRRRRNQTTDDKTKGKEKDVNNVTDSVEKEEKIGFARGLMPEKIIGAVETPDQQKHFLIKFNGCSQVDMVTYEEADEKCIQLVFKFFEERGAWRVQEDSGESEPE